MQLIQKHHIKKLALLCAILVCTSISTQVHAKRASGGSGGSHHVNGHFKKNGTYVQPHHATNPNHTQRDNYSSKPNVNPYTGKQGKKEPDH